MNHVEHCGCSHDDPEVVEQCDDSQGQVVIEMQIDFEANEHEQRKHIMAGYVNALKWEHAMNFFSRQLSAIDLIYRSLGITVIDRDGREK